MKLPTLPTAFWRAPCVLAVTLLIATVGGLPRTVAAQTEKDDSPRASSSWNDYPAKTLGSHTIPAVIPPRCPDTPSPPTHRPPGVPTIPAVPVIPQVPIIPTPPRIPGKPICPPIPSPPEYPGKPRIPECPPTPPVPPTPPPGTQWETPPGAQWEKPPGTQWDKPTPGPGERPSPTARLVWDGKWLGGQIQFRQTNGGLWQQFENGQLKFQLQQQSSNNGTVVLYDASRDVTVRLHPQFAEVKYPLFLGQQFHPFAQGNFRWDL